MKPYAAACDENRDPILSAIQPLLASCHHVLEIGSGTGQHAVYFGSHMPHLTWQTSDLAQHHPGIQQWLNEAALNNVLSPLALDVTAETWPTTRYDAVFSANTAHILSYSAVEALFAGLPRILLDGGLFLLYGPFNYQGNYTSQSNAEFDQWLKRRDPRSGIKHFEDLNQLAQTHRLTLQHDIAMPANNHILCWQKDPASSGSIT